MKINVTHNMSQAKYITIALLMSFIFWGCGKDTPKPVDPANKFVFDLQGVKDLNIENTGRDSMFLSISRKSGSSEKITLTLEGLPANMSYTITPDNGLPPFNAKVIISANNSAIGNFSTTLKATGATAGAIPYNISITTFKEDVECIPGILGNYSTDEDCQGSPVHTYNPTVIQDPDNKKGIIIKNFANVNIDVKANVVCGSSSLVIAEQKVGEYTISGTGTILPNKLKIDYKLTTNRISTVYTTQCSATYLKL